MGELHRPKLHALPEVVGEFIGWRAWEVCRQGRMYRLSSLGTGGKAYAMLWTPGRMMEATCSKSHGCETPGERCTCGFYAAARKEQLAGMQYPRYDDSHEDVKVWGCVALAGKVIPGTQGWRAQSCWPVELWVPCERPDLVKPLRDTYNVPVHVGNLVYTRNGNGAHNGHR